MSPLFAILALAGLFAVLLAPLLLAAWRPGAMLPVVGGTLALVALAAGFQSGLFASTPLPADLSVAATPVVSNAQCVEALSLLDRAGAIIDRRHPPRLVVAGDRWSQLPEEGQRVIVDCVERSWPSGHGAAQVEIRNQ